MTGLEGQLREMFGDYVTTDQEHWFILDMIDSIIIISLNFDRIRTLA